MGGPQARVRWCGQRLDIEWPAIAASCTELRAWCRTRDGFLHHSTAWARSQDDPDRFTSRCGPLWLRLSVQAGDDHVCLRADATLDVEADILEVAVTARPALPGGAPSWVVHNGYQSWDPAGVARAADGRVDSWWTIVLADGAGAGIAAAASTARCSCTMFSLADGVLGAIWREPEALETPRTLFGGPPATAWRSEEVRMAAARDARERLGTLLTVGPPPAAAATPTIGWLSWYHFGPWVRREDVLANAALLAGDSYRRLGYRLVQVDDGWQQAYGEWVPNAKFPGGLEPLAAALEAQGQVAGLWTAPFLVSVAADLATEAPDDWFVSDPSTGERAVDSRQRVFGPMHILDASVPAVQAHLQDLFCSLRRAGFRYFKIDFLYAGAYAGTAALRAGVRSIRAGAGDAHVVASGSPLLPVVGLVDACRIGPDTATPMYDFETEQLAPAIFGDEVPAVARNVAARSMLGRWFQLDTDIALVGGNLTIDRARQLVTLAALSGGPFLAADDLPALPADRLALLTNPEVLELVGGRPAVPEWEPDERGQPPSLWRRDNVVAVFNWDPAPREVALPAAERRRVRDLWERQDLPAFGDGAHLEVPSHGVRLVRIDRG